MLSQYQYKWEKYLWFAWTLKTLVSPSYTNCIVHPPYTFVDQSYLVHSLLRDSPHVWSFPLSSNNSHHSYSIDCSNKLILNWWKLSLCNKPNCLLPNNNHVELPQIDNRNLVSRDFWHQKIGYYYYHRSIV